MAMLGLSERDRNGLYMFGCIELLPALENEVFCSEVEIPVVEESFVSGIDDWWPGFVADVCL